MMEHDHRGHRERMRKRFLENGLDGFAPHEVLELLLFFAIPQRNVNPLAHKLLDHFGSLGAMLDALPEQLQQVSGVGENTAVLIAMVRPLIQYIEREGFGKRPHLTNYTELKRFCNHLFMGETSEVLYIICLDAQGRLLRADPAIRGTIDELPIYPRTIIGKALTNNAHAVILAHNHPSGVCEPSPADIQTTDLLRSAFAGLDIPLYDHMIYADGDCISLSQWQKEKRKSNAPAQSGGKKAADKKQGAGKKEKEGE